MAGAEEGDNSEGLLEAGRRMWNSRQDSVRCERRWKKSLLVITVNVCAFMCF